MVLHIVVLGGFNSYDKCLTSIKAHRVVQVLRKTGRKARDSTLPPAKKCPSVTLQAVYTSDFREQPGLFRKQAVSHAMLLLCSESHLQLAGGLSRSYSQNPWSSVRCSFLCQAAQCKLSISLWRTARGRYYRSNKAACYFTYNAIFSSVLNKSVIVLA